MHLDPWTQGPPADPEATRASVIGRLYVGEAPQATLVELVRFNEHNDFRAIFIGVLSPDGQEVSGHIVNSRHLTPCSTASVHGSHHIYVHANMPELLNLQNVNGQAKPSQVKQLLRLSASRTITLGARSSIAVSYKRARCFTVPARTVEQCQRQQA